MSNKKELLNELRIERDTAPNTVPVRGLGFWLPWVLLLLVVLIGGWRWWQQQSNAAITVAITRALAIDQAGYGQQGVLDATGYITARRQATVSSEITGKVVEVLVEEGMQVEQGQLLARLDDALLQANLELAQARWLEARSNLAEVEVALVEAQTNLRRIQNLQLSQMASEQALDEAQARVGTLKARLASLQQGVEVAASNVVVQQQQLDDTQIRAPFDGIVIDKAAQPGEMISPISAGGGFTRTGICTIVDMDSLEIEVDVSESYINRVQAGQAVEAVLNSYADWRIPAEVITIIPAADRNRATVRVRIRLLEQDQRILPDMGVKVSFLSAEDQTQGDDEALVGVWIPATALWQEQGHGFVYVYANEKTQKRRVSIGVEQADRVQISAGLRAGEQVITGLDQALVDRLNEDQPALEIISTRQ